VVYTDPSVGLEEAVATRVLEAGLRMQRVGWEPYNELYGPSKSCRNRNLNLHYFRIGFYKPRRVFKMMNKFDLSRNFRIGFYELRHLFGVPIPKFEKWTMSYICIRSAPKCLQYKEVLNPKDINSSGGRLLYIWVVCRCINWVLGIDRLAV